METKSDRRVIPSPPVFRGTTKASEVKGVKERMNDILSQIELSGENGLNTNDLQEIFNLCRI